MPAQANDQAKQLTAAFAGARWSNLASDREV